MLSNSCKFLFSPDETLKTTLYETTMVNDQRFEASSRWNLL